MMDLNIDEVSKYDESNLPLYVKIRRWWKSYKSETKWKGFIIPLLEDFLPGYYKLNRLYWAIRHRTINIYHKVDSGLKPSYYDIDTLMVNVLFNLLCRFVEEEHKGAEKLQQRIIDLSKWADEEIKHAKKTWEDKDALEKYIEGTKISHENEANVYKEALRIYKWWKEVYPFYEDNSPMSKNMDKLYSNKDSLTNHFLNTKPVNFDKDGDPTSYLLIQDEGEQREFRNKIYDEERIYDENMNKEIEDNMISLIKIRHHLWT